MPTVAVDWDDCLVYCSSGPAGEWTPGAREALAELTARGFTVTVLTCRANWPEGRAEVEEKLKELPFPSAKLTVVPKPLAVAYIDDRAVPYTGDWPQAVWQALDLGRRVKSG